MIKRQQIQKNLKLSIKLADYLAKNPNKESFMNKTVSYVFFSASDKELNKVNLKLAKSLANEGKTVIKAKETKDKKNPWLLIPLNN